MSQSAVDSARVFSHVSFMLSIKMPFVLLAAFVSKASKQFSGTYDTLADLACFLINMIFPALKKGTVVAAGQPGHAGIWPEYVPPADTDSRSPCPYINVLANHGIIPRSGRGVSLDQLQIAFNQSLGMSKPFAKSTVDSVRNRFKINSLDLDFLCTPNLIEHDASLTRQDPYFSHPDTSRPSKELVDKLLATASGPPSAEHPKGYLTPQDISNYSALREAQSKRDNPHFYLDGKQRYFGASNNALLYEVTKGDVAQLQSILIDERFPDGWETSLRGPAGFSKIEFLGRTTEIFLQQPRAV